MQTKASADIIYYRGYFTCIQIYVTSVKVHIRITPDVFSEKKSVLKIKIVNRQCLIMDDRQNMITKAQFTILIYFQIVCNCFLSPFTKHTTDLYLFKILYHVFFNWILRNNTFAFPFNPRNRLAEVNMDSSIIYQNIIHLEIGVFT